MDTYSASDRGADANHALARVRTRVRVNYPAPCPPESRKLCRLSCVPIRALCVTNLRRAGTLPDSLTVPSLLNPEHPITRSTWGSTRTRDVSGTIACVEMP